jgi:hypothetical protein
MLLATTSLRDAELMLARAVAETEVKRKAVTSLRNSVYQQQTVALELYHAAPAMFADPPARFKQVRERFARSS